MTLQNPTLSQAKAEARRLRAQMARDGSPISHAQSLEHVARQRGHRDWNTLSAAISDAPSLPWAVGDAVSGTYLSQPFTARVASATPRDAGWVEVSLHLDEAVDVVTSAAFSNLRKRIRGVIGPKGHSKERTSDGQAQLQIDL